MVGPPGGALLPPRKNLQSFLNGALPLKFLIRTSAFRGSGLSAKRRFIRSLKSSVDTDWALPVRRSRAISASVSWPTARNCAEGYAHMLSVRTER